MAPVMIAPPMMPAARPGPQPRRHCALASVAVPASVPVMMAAAVSAVSVFFMHISLRMVGSADQGIQLPRRHIAQRAIWLNPPSHLHYEHNYFVGILVIDKGNWSPNRLERSKESLNELGFMRASMRFAAA